MSKIPVETKVQGLDFDIPWSHLSETERNYAYFLAKSSWAGAKMVFHQLSYEAPALFLIFQAYFQNADFEQLETSAAKFGVSHEQFQQFLAYTSGFYGNMSNYHSFGFNKFVPEIPAEVFIQILQSHPLYSDTEDDLTKYKSVIDELYPQVETEIYAMEKPYNHINFPSEGGTTAYFSSNMTKDDLALVKRFADSQKINILNTRAFKTSDGQYVLTIGSVQQESSANMSFEGNQFEIKHGEFSPYLEECIMYLSQALKYAANDNQKEMIGKYIEHYKTGNVDHHKDSQRCWIKDKGPVVESCQGWIEIYADPENIRAYYEGFVAVVDKEKSKKFQALVENSEKIIPKLPWPESMEKDKFLAPDFTLLDVICFASKSCPLGINIPNYDDVRQEGFKNVFLSNSMPKAIKNMSFATPEQSDKLASMTLRTYQVHVACHELLGHGTGKLLYRQADGSQGTYTDPITNESFQSCYEEGEVWNTKFGTISASYEECRADTVGFYLCTLPEVYTLFGFEESEIDQMLWVNVMNHLRKGVLGLTLFNAETKKWGQAHTQGAFVFTQWIYKNQKSKIIDFEIVGDNEDFLIHLDEQNLVNEGKQLIEQLLVVLQTYKSTGANERGHKFYSEYSEVSDFFLNVREIVLINKKPRGLKLNHNLVRYNEQCIEPRCYPESFEGIILSYQERYPFNQSLYKQVTSQWNEHKLDLRVQPQPKI